MTDASTIQTTRPFGAHLAMRWWKPLVLTLVVVLAVYALQLVLIPLAAIVEVGVLGADLEGSALTPLTYLATNLAIIGLAPIALLVLAKMCRVPWRALLTVGRRFSWRRLGAYLAGFAGLLAIVHGTIVALEPASASAFAITGTTIGLLAVVVLTTPLQAASEELVFRGAMTAAFASWIRAVRPALIVGIVLSSLLFTVVHSSIDPWMNLHYVGLGASTAIMALIARGIEPAIAFHVANNVLSMGIGAFFTGGTGIPQDRSGGAAGPEMLLAIAAQAIAVLAVWWIERRRARIEG